MEITIKFTNYDYNNDDAKISTIFDNIHITNDIIEEFIKYNKLKKEIECEEIKARMTNLISKNSINTVQQQMELDKTYYKSLDEINKIKKKAEIYHLFNIINALKQNIDQIKS